jgi:hypothetical protein
MCHIVGANPAFFSAHFKPRVTCQNHCLCMPTKPDESISNRSIPVKDKLLTYREFAVTCPFFLYQP